MSKNSLRKSAQVVLERWLAQNRAKQGSVSASQMRGLAKRHGFEFDNDRLLEIFDDYRNFGEGRSERLLEFSGTVTNPGAASSIPIGLEIIYHTFKDEPDEIIKARVLEKSGREVSRFDTRKLRQDFDHQLNMVLEWASFVDPEFV